MDTITDSQNVDAACALCQRPGALQTYVQWGRTNCSNGHTTEYYGLIMASRSSTGD
jgi:hypothetical protein